MPNRKHPKYADDSTESVGLLLELRLPWLLAGLVVGGAITLIISRFEAVLARDVHLAFFIPIIVYMSDAVGTQTQTIYVRNLARKQVKLSVYIVKEMILGLCLGSILGLLVGLGAWLWLHNPHTAAAVGLAMFASVSSAPIVALLVSVFLVREKQDPALGSGPFTTAIQDLVSLLIYFAIASAIILN